MTDLLASAIRNPLAASPRAGLSPPRSPRLSIFGGKPKVVELDTTPAVGMKLKVANTSGVDIPMFVSKVDKKLGLVTLKPEPEAPPATEKKYLTLGEFSAVAEILIAEGTTQLTAEALSQLNATPVSLPPPVANTSKSPAKSRFSFFGSKSPAKSRKGGSSDGPNFGPGPIRPPVEPVREALEDMDMDDSSEKQEMSDNEQEGEAYGVTSPNKSSKTTSPRVNVKQQSRLSPKPATRIRNQSPSKPRTYAEIKREEDRVKEEEMRKLMREERSALLEQERKKLEKEQQKELDSIRFYEEQLKASIKLKDEKARQQWQEKKDLAESKVEFLTKQREMKQKEEEEHMRNSQFNANTRMKMKDEREKFESDRARDRASAKLGGANAFKDQQRNQEAHEQMLLKNAKEQNDLTSHMKSERERNEKKKQKEMGSAKAEGARALKAQKKKQEQTEQELLEHGKDLAKLNSEMRDARDKRDKELKADTDRTRKEGAEAIKNIKRQQEATEREILKANKEQGDAATLARADREKKEKEEKRLHSQSMANSAALLKTIKDTEYKNELVDQMANSKEQQDLAEHMKNERERNEKKKQKEMGSAKAEGARALKAQKKKQEQTEQELLEHGKDLAKLNSELREAREQNEKDAKLNASNAQLEGLKALSGIKKSQQERDRLALEEARAKSQLANEIKNDHLETEKRLKKEAANAKFEGIKALNDIQKTKQQQAEKELLEKDREQAELKKSIKDAQDKRDADLKNDLSKSVITGLRHHNDETAYNQWYRDQETLALNREASIVNEQYAKHVKKREVRQKAMVNTDRLDLLKRRREEEAEAKRKQDAEYLSSNMPMQAPEGSVVHRVKVKKQLKAEKKIATEAQMTLEALLAKEDLIEYLELLQSNGCLKVTDIGNYSEEELLAMSDKIVHRRKLLQLRKKFQK